MKILNVLPTLSPKKLTYATNFNSRRKKDNNRIKSADTNPNKQNQTQFLESDAFQERLSSNWSPYIATLYKSEKPEYSVIYDTRVRKTSSGKKEDIEFSQSVLKDMTVVELIIKDNKCIKITRINAPKENGRGICEHTIINKEKAETMRLNWRYPDMIYTYSGTKEGLKLMRNSVSSVKGMLGSEKYKNDIEDKTALNFQMHEAIRYLDKQINKKQNKNE